jgi:ribonuclease G
MKKEIIFNVLSDEVRIAMLEDNKLGEFFIEGSENERMIGDIYLGKVARVIPGIKAAFIDIGLNQDAFLHFSDVGENLEDYSNLIGDDTDIDTSDEELDSDLDEKTQKLIDDTKSLSTLNPIIEEKKDSMFINPALQLQKGQEIIIQVIKEAMGKKGVRVTSEVSIPGRFLVLRPFDRRIGVSRKITNFKEKKRLRRAVHNFLTKGFGIIIRTAAEGQEDAVLKEDLEKLVITWNEIEKNLKTEKPPVLLYKDMSMTSSIMRDLFTFDVSRVIVDSKKLFREIRAYVIWAAPFLYNKTELYKGKEPIFDYYKIEKEIEQLYDKKVILKSGGYIFVEHTEAMFVIDVNSGKYYGQTDQELNSLKTNLEAAREICRQLRLRDIGGLIVVDFIDLEDERNRRKVYDEVRKELRKDRAKSTILPMTEFGLMQITRQRIKQGLFYTVNEPCPTCGGTGIVKSKSSVMNRIERWLNRYKNIHKERRLILTVNPSIANYLKEGFFSRLLKLKIKFFVYIKIVPEPNLSPNEFRFFSTKSKRDVTNFFEK